LNNASLGEGVREAVAGGAGLDDVPAEGEPVDDGGAQPGVGEGLGPAGERLVGGDSNGVLLLAFGEDLEQEFGTAAVELHISELVDAEQVDAAVAGDGLVQRHLVGGFDELVHEASSEGVLPLIPRDPPGRAAPGHLRLTYSRQIRT
jgi:hypothetical protein